MNELLEKYKDKIDYQKKLAGSFQELVSTALVQIRADVKGNKELEQAIDSIGKRVKLAKNIFQVEQIRKDYAGLAKEINAHIKKRKKEKEGKEGGLFDGIKSLFGGGGGGGGASAQDARKSLQEAHERKGSVELVDAIQSLLGPYVDLLDSLARGTLLLADERESFYTPLKVHRARKFDSLKPEQVTSLQSPLYNFFINKSNEAATNETEREELKRIIGALTGYIQSVAVTSKSFHGKLDDYSGKIRKATKLEEIKQIQHSILTETLEIQKVNSAVRDKLSKTENLLNTARDKILRLEQDLEMARLEKSIDSLTMLYNRGFFDETLLKSLANFERYGEPCSLIMFDIDYFKKFNDSYGHQAGDQVLRVVSEITKESVRVGDVVARYGGEEFVVIVNRANLKNSAKVAENIRKGIKEHEFGILDKTVHVTVSLGVTSFLKGDKPESLIKRADKGLYDAKGKGRNRVVVCPS